MSGLEEQAAVARRDLELLGFPRSSWVPPRRGPDGGPVLDVLVVGGGMTGQTVAFALQAEGIDNVRVIDQAPRGAEGPWATFALMATLRSPKYVNGPDLGVASLTFRAWFESQHGAAAWDALGKIDRLDWAAYLLWVRDTVGLVIENDTELTDLQEVAGFWRTVLAGPHGTTMVFARKVVLALGRTASAVTMPSFASFSFDPASTRVVHSSSGSPGVVRPGEHVAILGAGASAFDHAATALEAGAAGATIHARATSLPQRNLYKPFDQRHIARGFSKLPPLDRWKLFNEIADAGVPPPQESVLRCERFATFALRLGSVWLDLVERDDGVMITTERGSERVDRVILATGFGAPAFGARPLDALRGQVLTWRDVVGEPEADAHPLVAAFPFLGDGFRLQPRPGTTSAGIGDLHLMDWTSQASMGARSGDVPGTDLGALDVAATIASDLFVVDAAHHRDVIIGFDEHELADTRWFVGRSPGSPPGA